MSFFVYHRYGVSEHDPAASIFNQLLDELEADPENEEHTSVSVTHESEWSLGCYRGGYVTYEHVEGDSEPRHMSGVPKQKVIWLMELVAKGDLTKLEGEPWCAGY